MSQYRSEKTFLERLADRIPGLAGYRAREERRDTDKRLRDYLAGRLDRGRESLDRARQAWADAARLEGLDAIGRLERRLRRATDSLRHASYGYSGAFDQVRMREEELERLYRFDLELVDRVEAVEKALGALTTGPEAAVRAGEQVDGLLDQIARRREIFEAPHGQASTEG